MECYEAEIIKVSTTKDGAFRVILDFPNFKRQVGHYLADCAIDNKTVNIVFIDNATHQEIGTHHE